MPRPASTKPFEIANELENLRGMYTLKDLRHKFEAGPNGDWLRKALTLAKNAKKIKTGIYEFSEDAPITATGLGYIPTADPDFILDEAVEAYIPYLQESDKSEMFRLIGPKGTGKTSTATEVAALLGKRICVVDFSLIRTPIDLMGHRILQNGSIEFIDSEFTRCIEAGNHVIVLDEINRASDMVGNALMPLLDHRGKTMLYERGKEIVVGPGTVFFATMNKGKEYTGTSVMDAALEDRFSRTIEVTYLDDVDETNLLHKKTGLDRVSCGKLVDLARKTRDGDDFTTQLSTRQLLAAARDLKHVGFKSLKLTVVNLFSPIGGDSSERQAMSMAVIQAFGGDEE
jgi:nitric oxide reductase NorQ protein